MVVHTAGWLDVSSLTVARFPLAFPSIPHPTLPRLQDQDGPGVSIVDHYGPGVTLPKAADLTLPVTAPTSDGDVIEHEKWPSYQGKLKKLDPGFIEVQSFPLGLDDSLPHCLLFFHPFSSCLLGLATAGGKGGRWEHHVWQKVTTVSLSCTRAVTTQVLLWTSTLFI